MTEILPERMTAGERDYAEELLAASLLQGFRTVLNPELARAIAKLAAEQIEIYQAYNGKQI